MEGSFSGSTPTTRILGIGLLEGAGDAADESAAADGNDDSLDVGDLLEELESDGALAGDDFRIVKGMDESAALFNATAQSLVTSFRRSFRREE